MKIVVKNYALNFLVNTQQIIFLFLVCPIFAQVLSNAELRVLQQQQIKQQFQNLNQTVEQIKNISEFIEDAEKNSCESKKQNLILPVSNSYYNLVDTIFSEASDDDKIRLNQTNHKFTNSQLLQKVAKQPQQYNSIYLYDYQNNQQNQYQPIQQQQNQRVYEIGANTSIMLPQLQQKYYQPTINLQLLQQQQATQQNQYNNDSNKYQVSQGKNQTSKEILPNQVFQQYQNQDLQILQNYQNYQYYNNYNDINNIDIFNNKQKNVTQVKNSTNSEMQELPQFKQYYRSQKNNTQNEIQNEQQCENKTKKEVESIILGGQDGMWASLLHNFCNVKSFTDILKMENDTISICCGLVDKVINGACQQYQCQNVQNVGQQLSILSVQMRDKYQFWDLVCNIKKVERKYDLQQAQKCQIENALDFFTEQKNKNTNSDFKNSNLNEIYNNKNNQNQYNTDIQIKQTQNSLNLNGNYDQYNARQINILHEGQQVNLQMNINVKFDEIDDNYTTINFNNNINIYDAIRQNLNLQKFSSIFEKDINFLESRINQSFLIFAPSDAAIIEAEKTANIDFSANQNVSNIFWFHVAFVPIEFDVELISKIEFKNIISENLKLEVLENKQLKISGCCSDENSAIVMFNQKYQQGELFIIDKLLFPNEIARNIYQK